MPIFVGVRWIGGHQMREVSSNSNTEFYRAKHSVARYCQAKLSVRPSVRLSVIVVMHIGWNSSKIIPRPISLTFPLSTNPSMMNLLKGTPPNFSWNKSRVGTRKLCYRKDDRAMRPTYGCPANFLDSLTMSTANIPNIFMGFCSGRPYECSYKI